MRNRPWRFFPSGIAKNYGRLTPPMPTYNMTGDDARAVTNTQKRWNIENVMSDFSLNSCSTTTKPTTETPSYEIHDQLAA
jgi:hypothetical protein